MSDKPSINVERPEQSKLDDSPELAFAWAIIDNLVDHLDMDTDEFQRIRVATTNEEVIDLCDRALSSVKRRVPVLVELEETKYALEDAQLEIAQLKKQLNNQ